MIRLFELLLLISFVPAIVVPFLPLAARPRWLRVAAALLPVLIFALHAALEGLRVQMLPAYVLTVLVLALQASALSGAPERQSVIGRIGAGALALLVILNGIIAGWLFGIPVLPQATGAYAVGVTQRLLTDSARDRSLMATLWYPAAQAGAPSALIPNPDETAIAVSDFFALPAVLLQHIRYITLPATENAPLLASDTPFPVLVFSHGLGGLRSQAASLLQNFASHGYVVLAIDHTYAAAVTVPTGGDPIYFDLSHFGLANDLEGEPYRIGLDANVFPVWVADQQFAYDTLEAWNSDDQLLAGRLDLTRIGSFGHSFGGATSAEICRIDERCQAAIDLDGYPFGGFVQAGPARPLMYLSADPNRYSGAASARPVMQTILQPSDQPVYWFSLRNSTHYSFTDMQLLSPLMAPEQYDPRAGLEIIYRYTLAFFDTYLRGADAMSAILARQDAGVNRVLP
jgi:predicted dienelactone hydrolase